MRKISHQFICKKNKPRIDILRPRVQARMLGHLTSDRVRAIQIDVMFDGKEREVVFGSVYLPYDSTDLPSSKEMVSLVNYGSHNNYPVIIGCDTNSHNLCWGSTLQVIIIEEMLYWSIWQPRI